MTATSAGTTVSAEQAEQQRRGLMLVLSSPSGAGKSTIARLLLDKEDNLELSISVTTRPRRSSEVDGVHYHFLDSKRFEQMREHDELLECNVSAVDVGAVAGDKVHGAGKRPVDVFLKRQIVLHQEFMQSGTLIVGISPNF